MHAVVVDFTIKRDFIDAFRARVEKQAQDSLSLEPGCHVFDVCLDPSAPERVFLYEVYETAADFEAHQATQHFKAFIAEVTAWVAEKDVRQLSRIEVR